MEINKDKIIISVLVILLLWFGISIIRLENYHYAVQVGMCENSTEKNELKKHMAKEECLNNTQTRTSPILHLLYGLKIF